VAAAFAAAVPVYGSVVGFFDHYGARLVDLAGVGPGMRVLDVAAGKGSSARPAQALGAQVVAGDLTPEMVEALRSQGLDARVMDGEAIDEPDASFDRVLCGFGLFFFPHPERGAAEFHRVLKPGGLAACSLPVRVFPPVVHELLAEYAGRAAGPAIPTPPQGQNAADHLAAAGFSRIEVVDEEQDFEFDSARSVWQFVLTTIATDVLDRLGPEDRAEIESRSLAAMGDGPVTVTTSARYWLASG
jgi:ubiquinone/menaquinone biosynthesis C-methylase UbiE